ncbi:hypothetical protein, partial [Serratia marcescens]|uniref:hypothetical protein n=1 Tax=Serratia marcescens TaxID=615 RepID=UPI00281469E9
DNEISKEAEENKEGEENRNKEKDESEKEEEKKESEEEFDEHEQEEESEVAAKVILELAKPPPASNILTTSSIPITLIPIVRSPIAQSPLVQNLEVESNDFRSFVTATLMDLKDRITVLEKKAIDPEEIRQLKNIILKLENSNRNELSQMRSENSHNNDKLKDLIVQRFDSVNRHNDSIQKSTRLLTDSVGL